jgi:hypothetical protein
MVPIDRPSLYLWPETETSLRNVVFEMDVRTMNDAENCDSYNRSGVTLSDVGTEFAES